MCKCEESGKHTERQKEEKKDTEGNEKGKEEDCAGRVKCKEAEKSAKIKKTYFRPAQALRSGISRIRSSTQETGFLG